MPDDFPFPSVVMKEANKRELNRLIVTDGLLWASWNSHQKNETTYEEFLEDALVLMTKMKQYQTKEMVKLVENKKPGG